MAGKNNNGADGGVNGDPAALTVDRAIGEIRRGRAIQISEADRSFVAAAVDVYRTRYTERVMARRTRAERASGTSPPEPGAGPVAAPDQQSQ